jgi:hypothetical protein
VPNDERLSINHDDLLAYVRAPLVKQSDKFWAVVEVVDFKRSSKRANHLPGVKSKEPHLLFRVFKWLVLKES